MRTKAAPITIADMRWLNKAEAMAYTHRKSEERFDAEFGKKADSNAPQYSELLQQVKELQEKNATLNKALADINDVCNKVGNARASLLRENAELPSKNISPVPLSSHSADTLGKVESINSIVSSDMVVFPLMCLFSFTCREGLPFDNFKTLYPYVLSISFILYLTLCVLIKLYDC